MSKLFNKNTLNFFDYFLIVGVISCSVIYSILSKEIDILGSIAAITGLICVVLVAKGNILNYVFGVINVSLYAYISFKSEIYGDAALNALYYLPMQFIGWFSWNKKRQKEDETKVEGKRMTSLQRIIWFAGSAITVVICGYILKYFNDPQPFKDAATTILSVIAMYLMVRAYMEQWVLWIVVNIISVVMWVIVAFRGDPHSELMVIMWVFYLANSINGFRVWIKLSKNSLTPAKD